MRFFGIYFGIFCCLFFFLITQNIDKALIFGAKMSLFYFIISTILIALFLFGLFTIFKKSPLFLKFSSLFSSFFSGAVAIFALTLAVNRASLIVGSYFLYSGLTDSNLFYIGAGTVFLVLGYTLLNPFKFDFLTQKMGETERKKTDSRSFYKEEEIIDVEPIEDFDKLDRR